MEKRKIFLSSNTDMPIVGVIMNERMVIVVPLGLSRIEFKAHFF